MSKDAIFKKIGYTTDSVVKTISKSEFESIASDEINSRLNKFAQTIRAIAPRSDDFLYFSIIFLKAAEVSTIDESGNLKKVGKENAWGYFDDNWKWHGNVKPHKNNNNDIFPESELKKAARSWIGRPLCVDHKSDSVDGVRGIILDTHYDERLKQVVGLCALDKVNYPDLARKVSTGVVRYGSMGTAVATSVCSECSNKATTPKEYCSHISSKSAWGEINVGLNPIEYSLVVQPAEPGAMLLRCFASIEKHNEELKSYGVDTEKLYKSLDDKTANDLDLLLNSVCGVDGCSIEQRQRIVKGYLNTNGFTKVAQLNSGDSDVTEEEAAALRNLAEAKEAFGQDFDAILELISSNKKKAPAAKELSLPEGESLNSGSSRYSDGGDISFKSQRIDTDVGGVTTARPSGDESPEDFADRENVGDIFDAPNTVIASKNKTERLDKISSIMEEIMNEARLRKRAALRRRLAYHQGGSDGVEPKGFKSEDYHKYWEDDKHMHQTKSMGGDDGMFPGDEKVKEMQKRAKEKAVATKKIAYHFGGSDGVEPKTFKSEDYHKYWEDDKHMHQGKSMGGDDGMFPGDEKIKEMQKRAKYNGPTLSTKFKQRRAVDGSINKAASCFEVYAGNKLVIAATARDIFGPKLEENWSWITSKDYAREVVAQIRQNGLEYVGSLLTKKAQAAPPDMPPAPPADDMGAPPPGDAPAPPADAPAPPGDMGPPPPGAEGEEGADKAAPKQVVEDALIVMEDKIEEIRDAMMGMAGGEEVKVDINVGKGGAEVEGESGEDKIALSSRVYKQLKISLAEAKDSADELALLSETYDRYRSLSQSQRRELSKLTTEAIRDFSGIMSESTGLISVAKKLENSLVKKSSKVAQKVASTRTKAPAQQVKKAEVQSNDLVKKALDLRKERRLSILKEARESMLEHMSEDTVEHSADDGMDSSKGTHSKVKTHSLEEVAMKQPTGGMHSNYGDDDVLGDMGEDMDDMDDMDEDMGEDEDMDEDEDVDLMPIDDSDHHHHEEEEGEEEEEEEFSSLAKDMKSKKMKKMKQKKEKKSPVKEALSQTFLNKKAEEERESYRIKLRRAYNVAMEMQRKGLIAGTKPALDRQVDTMMDFDDKAFEAFKRSVANFQGTVSHVKTASDVSGLNVGINQDGDQPTQQNGKLDAKTLASLWE